MKTIIVLLAASCWLLGTALSAQAPALMTVKGTLYDAGGTPASGDIQLTWPAFVSSDAVPIFGGTLTVPVSAGAVCIQLAPNSGASPSGTSYNVRFYPDATVFFEETWIVPTSLPVATPGTPTSVTQAGTPGSTTYYYFVSATNATGETLLGPGTVTTTSAATLNGTDYNIISWASVSGATGYRVWRSSVSAPPVAGTTGLFLVGATASTTINDQANTLNSATVPSCNDTDPETLSSVRVVRPPSPSIQFAPTQVIGTAVVKSPSSGQTITAPLGSGVPLAVKGRNGNASNVFEGYDNAATPVLQWRANSNGDWFFNRAPTFSSMTLGSCLFAGTAGLLAQDNANCFWDDAAKRLGIGTNLPQRPLHVSGSGTQFRFQSSDATSHGIGEFYAKGIGENQQVNWNLNADDDLGNSTIYAGIGYVVTDNTDGTEDGELRFRLMAGGLLPVYAARLFGAGASVGTFSWQSGNERQFTIDRRTSGAGDQLSLIAGGAQEGGTNLQGGPLVLQTGLGTGNSVPALARIQQDALGMASGTTDHTRVDRLITGASKVLVNNTNTALVNATIANNTVVAGMVRYAVEVFDGTDVQVEEGTVAYHATNKAGTVANNTTVKFGNQQAATAGTLTVTWTITAANPAVLTINANSSLTPTVLRVTYNIENLTQQAVAVQ